MTLAVITFGHVMAAVKAVSRLGASNLGAVYTCRRFLLHDQVYVAHIW